MMIIVWLQQSLVFKIYMILRDFYKNSAIYHAFDFFKRSYMKSHIKVLYNNFGQYAVTENNSQYVKKCRSITDSIQKYGIALENSLLWKMILTVCNAISRFFRGSICSRIYAFLGLRGILIATFCFYLPIDYFLRNIIKISILSALWDEGLMMLAFLYVFVRRMISKNHDLNRVAPLGAYILCFLGVTFFLMCVISPYMLIAINGYRATVQYMLWFFLMIRLIEDDRDFEIFYTLLCISAIAIALHGLYQFAIGVPIPANWMSGTEDAVRTRVFSITGSPNIMGSFLVLFAPMVAGIAYYSKRLCIKTISIALTGAMCLSILFTFSKGAWGGLFISILVFAIYLDRRLITFMVSAGAFLIVFVPSIAARMTYLLTSDYREASMRAGRMIRWQKGLELLHDNTPFLGVGLGRFGGAVAMNNKIWEETPDFSYFYMDNYYLKTLIETGYLGLTFFIIMLIGLVLWSARALYKTSTTSVHPLCVGMFAGLCGVLTHCCFENIFEVPYMMAYFWSLAAGITYLGYFRRGAKAIWLFRK